MHFFESRAIMPCVSKSGRISIGMSPSGKAPDFDSGIRRFKSCHPSQYDPLAQLAEQLPFKQWVRSSNLRRVTRKRPSLSGWSFSVPAEIRKIKSQHPGGVLLPPVQTLVATIIFALRAKMQTNRPRVTPRSGHPSGSPYFACHRESFSAGSSSADRNSFIDKGAGYGTIKPYQIL